MHNPYTPPIDILEKYADVMVGFALNGGSGIRPNEVVYLMLPEWARPFLDPLQSSILKAGGHLIVNLMPTGIDKQFYALASDEQLTFFPAELQRALVNTINHRLGVKPFESPHGLEGVPPSKINARTQSSQPFRKWLNDKEIAGLYSWTLCFWGTEEYAAEAGMTLEEYWQQIIAACYLDERDPVHQWRETFTEIERVRKILNSMAIDRLHMTAEGTDLWVTLGRCRTWCGGSGRNIPSFEIFTSPYYRDVQGRISFNQPFLHDGSKILGISLEFVDGKVVEAHASANENVLLEMITQPNANHLGEFSLTDSRLSRIKIPMANTLFDENMGGPFGNTHIALGMSYKIAYNGDASKLNPIQWEQLGFNDPDCAIHADIIDTRDRVVEAILENGTIKTIYRDGRFVI